MKLIVFNLKMNLLKQEIENYISSLKDIDLTDVVFCPPAIYIERFNNNNITVGSQDISFALMGQYTGDISILQLKELGIKYSIIGHSERRDYYMDSRFVNKKLSLCLENNIIPLLCVGESLEENSRGETFNICIDEIDKAFINNIDLDSVIIVYEPIWAIGSGIIPTLDIVEENISRIKKYVSNKYNLNLKVLYGGSVSEDNIGLLSKSNIIDGFLIGSNSLKIDTVKNIINVVKGV